MGNNSGECVGVRVRIRDRVGRYEPGLVRANPALCTLPNTVRVRVRVVQVRVRVRVR